MGAGASVDESMVARAEAVFASMDANKSGTIDTTELKGFLTSSGIEESAAGIQADLWFDNLNQNNDGKVSLAEYKEFFETHLKEMGLELTISLLEWFEAIAPKFQGSEKFSALASRDTSAAEAEPNKKEEREKMKEKMKQIEDATPAGYPTQLPNLTTEPAPVPVTETESSPAAEIEVTPSVPVETVAAEPVAVETVAAESEPVTVVDEPVKAEPTAEEAAPAATAE
mmetsp:Transcript_5404/g.7028  ORF Transcript_5404/g.7028 Transcript_5404/m.7028 type:complete len:227 (-) Transcript_5404:163-843(-)